MNKPWTTKRKLFWVILLVIALIVYHNYNRICSYRFFLSMRYHYEEEAEMLLQLPWDVNAYGKPIIDVFAGKHLPLAEASANHETHAVEILLKRGANPNKYYDGYWHPVTAAMSSAISARYPDALAISEMLFAYGADVSMLTGIDSPLLRLALCYESSKSEEEQKMALDITKYLFNKGARYEGSNIINHAARANNLYILRYLIEERGIDVHEKDVGDIAMYLATYNSSYEAAEYLIAHGADINVSYEGKTPMDVAVDKNDIRMIKILQK